MPVITLEAGKLNKEQKSQLVKELTDKASKIMNVPEQAFVVLLKENEADNIGTGGQLLSQEHGKIEEKN
ncbi:4-oxalocrotonate tautomerase DmpI [Sporolactobacillus pectinivorans]|uniref:4-oxalocrotonate tautomerase DmpI n=1 Tax=Sporolactobacillus pectinivorans TaxID=1591408 RepID=UPI000C25B122|nr:4-oxalocrotonate tautomerase DmpI [Sporolactobacillus pectinivorans]